MIKVKHVLEAVEKDDGQRIWIEPIGLTRDLREWCEVDHVLPHLGPPIKAWNLLEKNPDAYDYFRAQYHEQLKRSPYASALKQLAVASRNETFTLLHQGDNPDLNSAAALHEFLIDLQAYCKPE